MKGLIIFNDPVLCILQLFIGQLEGMIGPVSPLDCFPQPVDGLYQEFLGDRLVPVAATRPVYERLGRAGLRTVRLYDGLYHEAYNEPEREQVIADLEAWVAAHL